MLRSIGKQSGESVESVQDQGSEHCDERVCLSLCLSAQVSQQPPVQSPANVRRMFLVATTPPACGGVDTGNESVPIQLAQCWFPRPAISNAKI